MKAQNWLHKLSSFFLMMVVTLSMAQPGMVGSALAKTSSDENVVYDPLTGALAFVGSDAGSPVASALAGTPVRNASAFTEAYASKLGLSNVAADLTLTKTSSEANGRSTVRYQQKYLGVPVFGGEVIVNTDANGAMLSLTAKTSPNLNLSTVPTLTTEVASAAAVQAIAKYNQVEASSLITSTANLQIYDSRLISPDGLAPRLVWNMTVSNLKAGISETVLVDANSGALVLHYQQMDVVASAPETTSSNVGREVLGVPLISIYSVNNLTPAPTDPLTSWQTTFVCDQSNKAACDGVGGDDVDATNAYLNALDAYNFMKTYLKIDSINNAGAAITGSIHYGSGYQKNFWVTSIHVIGYGDGYTGADDMAGHAMGFGLLEYSSASGLILVHQTGAIAESLSDMWGEFIDQTNGRGTDTAGFKWTIGEDWPLGPQRSMSDPANAAYNHPDRMGSSNYYVGTNNSIGIYANAGVNNKAVYLMTDGGTFNGKTITGLGIAKVSAIYYEVEKHLLASASNYFDLYYAVKQACHTLVATGQSGIKADDCDQVKNALDAVEMNLTSSPTVYPVASFCPPADGTSKGSSIFFDSFENGTANWTITNTASPTDLWTPITGNATNGLNHFQGPESSSVASQSIAQTTNAVLIPSGHKVFLFFEHLFNFETSGINYHDGGILYYSTDNGANWQDSSSLFNSLDPSSGLGYNGLISSGQGNPLEGQQAFIDSVASYVSSRYNLTPLAGQQVKFRWIVGSDNSGGGSGWYLDNVQIYPCVLTPSVPTLVSPTVDSLQTNYKPTLDWSDSTPDLDHYVVQVSTTSAFTTLAYQSTVTASRKVLTVALTPNKKYYWRVRAYNAANDAGAWSAVRYFRTALAAPILQSATSSWQPSFNWTDVATATGYTIQVSKSSTFSILTINTPTKASAYTSTIVLQLGKVYYWRVRTNGANGPGPWSVVKSFKTP